MSRVLVVEDEPNILRVITLWLSRQGHQVAEARNGIGALEQLAKGVPDVLITDVNMPGMDGLQLLSEIMGTPRQPRGVIVMTNRWDHREIGAQLQSWGVHVATKPVSPSKLAALVAEIATGEVPVSEPDSAGGQT